MILTGAILKDPQHALHNRPVDLHMEGEVITSIQPTGEGAAQSEKSGRSVDLGGLWIFPGLIDIHVHFREPGLEHKETIRSGSRAAVAGGFTSVACMANTQPVNDSAFVCESIVQSAKKDAACRVFPIGAVTRGLRGLELADIGGLAEAGAVAISDDGMPVMNSFLMRQALEYAGHFSIPVVSHAEDAHLVGKGCMNEGKQSELLGLHGNPTAAEEIMVARDIALARLTRSRVHIAHLTSALALRHIVRAKEEGLAVTCEVSPHHLSLSDEDVGNYNTHCKMAPPLRTAQDVEALQEGVAKGWIDCFATDHAPHHSEEKNVEFENAPFGITGLQSAVGITMELVQKNVITLDRWIEAWTSRPASLFPALAKKSLGRLAVGGPADLMVFDPQTNWEYNLKNNASKSANSPFLGRSWKGQVVWTVVAGVIRYDRAKRI